MISIPSKYLLDKMLSLCLSVNELNLFLKTLLKKNDLHKQNNQTKESSFHVQKPKPVIISTPHPLSLCILRTTKQCLSPHVTFCSFPTCSGHTVLLSLTFFPVLTHRLHIHPHVPDDLTTPLLDSDTCPLELVKCAVPL